MIYGLIGARLGHSFSKEVHSLIGDYDYELKEIGEDSLAEFFARRNFKGINITIPYKEKIIPFLDFVSPEAQKIGAVNTVVNRDGKLFGYNTDFFGLKGLITRTGVSCMDKKAVILGGGGTFRTARAVLSSLGAKEIISVGRTEGKCDITFDRIGEVSDAEIIVNATPVGTYPESDGKLVDFGSFRNAELFIDVVYNPLRTRSVGEAKRAGKTASGGLYMLVGQAVAAYGKFTDKDFSESELNEKTEKIYREIFNDKENIVLIGMPSSGKTTVGKIIAEKTGKTFVDTDEQIILKTGTDIPPFFALYGEDKFREVEKEIVKEVSSRSGLVIATGGGVVLRGDNVNRLKQNGRIYFLDRPLSMLTPTSDRPTAASAEQIRKRYDERCGLYLAAADFKADGGKNAQTVAEEIIKEFYGERNR